MEKMSLFTRIVCFLNDTHFDRVKKKVDKQRAKEAAKR
jgi:hypothetical protein